ncbi:MAG: hypothetical protein ACRDHN_05365, partial [Thermomicrobiales bacterium]
MTRDCLSPTKATASLGERKPRCDDSHGSFPGRRLQSLEPVREVVSEEQGHGLVNRRSMMQIMARRMKVTVPLFLAKMRSTNHRLGRTMTFCAPVRFTISIGQVPMSATTWATRG